MERHHILSLATALTISLLSANAAAAPAASDWQLGQLQNPSPGLVKAEARGRVTIYDGLKGQQVERAMDEQFDRIDNMMFIRTLEQAPDGGYVAEDDDC
jgi:hypothetical protein